MKLKEIELDLPYQKDNEFIQQLQESKKLECSEATRQDYEINWKEMRRDFQLMTRCMTSMIERLMKPINTKDCWKILIECVDECAEEGYRNLLGVYAIQIVFDWRQFFGASDFHKKEMVIDIVQEAMKRFSNSVDFEVDNINTACNEIIKRNYLNEWFWGKSCSMGEKNARIKIIHDINDVKIYVQISENNILSEEKLLVCTLPDERSYGLFLGELRWISKDEVALITKSGDVYV